MAQDSKFKAEFPILAKLDWAGVLTIDRRGDVFEFCEMADLHNRVNLTADEVLQLADELRRMVDSA